MTILTNTIFKINNYCRCNVLLPPLSRFTTAPCLNYPKQTLEEKLGLNPRPKKPQTPFFRFLGSIRPELLQQKPSVKPTEIAKLAGERWKTIDENTKNQYKKKYEEELLKYQEELKNYDHKLSPGDRDLLLMEKANIKLKKERSQLKKRREALGCPKRPASAYLLYMKTKLPERGNLPFLEWQSKLAKEWNSCSAEEKSKYTDLHKTELAEYRKKMAKWEKEMELKGLDTVMKKMKH